MTATIEARGLKKRFGKVQALDGLDLVAERGQVVAVLGPNGAGKTTFVRTVATLLRPDEGTLHVAGHDVRKDPDAVRQLIGLAGQFAAVEPGDDRTTRTLRWWRCCSATTAVRPSAARRRCSSSWGS